MRRRTVTDAAVDLGMAPSSVSEQLRRLEASLGVPLFDRTATGMRPTAAGERMAAWARRLLDDAEHARRDVTGEGPAVRLGALETLAAVCVPRVLAALAERRPALTVEVRPSVSRDDLLAEVTAGRLDAALLMDTGDALGALGFAPPPAPLTYLDVDSVPLALVAAPGHPLLEHAQLTSADLAGERLLVNVPNCSFFMAADRFIGPGPERVHAGSVPVMLAWAQWRLGIALLPEFAVSDALASGGLARLALPIPDLALRLVWHPDREDQPGLRDMLYAASIPASPARTGSPRSGGCQYP